MTVVLTENKPNSAANIFRIYKYHDLDTKRRYLPQT